jgi:hypothetical protein
MVLHLSIPFTGLLPSVELVAAQVALNTGLPVGYEHERWTLVCGPLGADFGLYLLEDRVYGITVLGMSDYKRDYLLEATLATLVDLGGQYHGSLPAWAGQPWEIAKLLL